MNRQGFVFLIPAFTIFLVLFVFGVYHPRLTVLFLSMLFLLFSLFIVYFFRDPDRIIPPDNNFILSAADGKVISIKPIDAVEFIGKEGTIISVFMSVFDVHVNRIPISGKVNYIKYNKGKFLPAFEDKASLENEQNELGLDTSQGKIILKQIAGIIARRIVCKVKPGDAVKAGERFGMIKFGSRVDLFLPQSVEIKVDLNQKVKAGETVIGVFKP
ncbi:MAG: phosphatidylserine decarboxylase family protein [Candidatus Zixiibacteriota bacterium]